MVHRRAVVVVDPFSSGMCLAQMAMERGFACISVYSDIEENMADWLVKVPTSIRTQYTQELFHPADAPIAPLVAAIRALNFEITGVLAGAEPGVVLTDLLADAFNVRSNGAAGSAARRNKYVMGEAIRSAGLRAVKQSRATSWQQIEQFIAAHGSSVVVKPVDSAGSDDVFLCSSVADASRAFHAIVGKTNHLGLVNTACLVQEYLGGTEYVVDTVSRDGQHKVVAVWEYDKRAVNGAAFVYFGVWLRPVACPITKALVQYTLKVLDAVGIRHGPGHAEVKWLPEENQPCLIEVGARLHGRDGTDIPILNRCQGYSIASATLDAYFNEKAFRALPAMPTSLRAFGCKTTFVSYDSGMLCGMPGMREVETMPSFVESRVRAEAGVKLSPTIDAYTTPGCVLMVHEDKDILERDYNRVRELERSGLYLIDAPAALHAPVEIAHDSMLIVAA
ncbi:hypothetical protein Ae201684P_016904 [Aphanomyces euteiches]|uniref:ATP-grasp domain-containing protein n=1 Tax=Aphanomyces euteiches TaxID=100861 RepID=A0A6G0XJJ4_9STRA|nr:hypothetical protein Ae201684_004131 [Aphanomyces euteiches]KAH9094294.1 hypothetical protein Ae201684P_016904 [Aphanomyces euteiches]KAH9151995.1 hypothetical protein AeRB84_005509 [Aphanomyces euteiches]